VVHSATKYLNGHSDVVAGLAVVGDNAALAESWAICKCGRRRTRPVQQLPDAARYPYPGAAWSATANALLLAEWLEQQPQVERSGSRGWPRIRIISWRAGRWLPGGMISVVVKGDDGYAERIISKLRCLPLRRAWAAWRAW
jgi:cystathionine gamma-lyase